MAPPESALKPSRGAPAALRVCLVGDIGGTNCRLALAQIQAGDLTLDHARQYKCADFPSTEDAIDTYLRSVGWNEPLGATVIAIAGPISGGVVKSTNMHWRLSEDGLKGHGTEAVKLINDFTALALSVERLGPRDVVAIGPRLAGDPRETVAVIGAGTGFGAGALTRGIGGAAAIATEGGHVSFAPVDEMEIEILRILTRRFGRVSIERLLSGPGLVNLHLALAEIEGRPQEAVPSEDIVRRAEAGDAVSQRTVERFCKAYGSAAGDFALSYGARGGVLLAGGIAPAISAQIQRSGFRERFEAKGRFQPYMATIPTLIVKNSQAALLGAAHLAHALAGAHEA